jgi:hypothetical protein
VLGGSFVSGRVLILSFSLPFFGLPLLVPFVSGGVLIFFELFFAFLWFAAFHVVCWPCSFFFF